MNTSRILARIFGGVIAVLLLAGFKLLAQFSIPQQPIFSNAASSAQEFATNLAHRWIHTNLATNVSFQVWTDSVTQVHQFLVAGGGTMTNTTLGVRFTSAGASMTNRWGVASNLFNTIGPTGETNYGMGVIFKYDAINDFNIRNLFGQNVLNDGNPQFSINTGQGDGPLQMYVSANNFLWAPNPMVTPATNWFAMAWGATNTGTGEPCFVSWINGEFATNHGPNTANGPFKTVGMRNTNPAIMTFNFRGWIKEIWVRTNMMNGNGFDGFAKDLNYVRTNVYEANNL